MIAISSCLSKSLRCYRPRPCLGCEQLRCAFFLGTTNGSCVPFSCPCSFGSCILEGSLPTRGQFRGEMVPIDQMKLCCCCDARNFSGDTQSRSLPDHVFFCNNFGPRHSRESTFRFEHDVDGRAPFALFLFVGRWKCSASEHAPC